MKKLLTLIIALAALLTMALAGASCTTTPPGTPIPTDSQVQVPHQDTAEDFLKNSATFKFDGIEGSIMLIKAEE